MLYVDNPTSRDDRGSVDNADNGKGSEGASNASGIVFAPTMLASDFRSIGSVHPGVHRSRRSPVAFTHVGCPPLEAHVRLLEGKGGHAVGIAPDRSLPSTGSRPASVSIQTEPETRVEHLERLVVPLHGVLMSDDDASIHAGTKTVVNIVKDIGCGDGHNTAPATDSLGSPDAKVPLPEGDMKEIPKDVVLPARLLGRATKKLERLQHGGMIVFRRAPLAKGVPEPIASDISGGRRVPHRPKQVAIQLSVGLDDDRRR